jgi:hypothetical protein
MQLYIDCFRKQTRGHYILTHSHTDHSYIQKSFPHSVHCSPLTYILLKDRYKQLRPTLVPGVVYLDKRTKLFVFHNSHAPDSIGIFVYRTGMLYWGEGRFVHLTAVLSALKTYRIQTVIHDIPSTTLSTIDHSVMELRQKMESASIHTVILRNYAQFLLLQPLRHWYKFVLLPCVPTPKGVACDIFITCFEQMDWSTTSTRVIQVVKGTNGTCCQAGSLIISGHRPIDCDHIITYSSHASESETIVMLDTIKKHNKKSSK